MIPVHPQPEPNAFNDEVRIPGLKWLRENGIALDGPPPESASLPALWRNMMKELWVSYGKVCAYLCIYICWPTGAVTTDHFVAKSRNAGLAYEWLNYRLCCLGANRRKNRFDDILDPFEIEPDTFFLHCASGEIFTNPALPVGSKEKAEETIRRLNLNDPMTQDMRAEHFGKCMKGRWSEEELKEQSPFVWYEARRQGWL